MATSEAIKEDAAMPNDPGVVWGSNSQSYPTFTQGGYSNITTTATPPTWITGTSTQSTSYSSCGSCGQMFLYGTPHICPNAATLTQEDHQRIAKMEDELTQIHALLEIIKDLLEIATAPLKYP